MFTAVYIFIFCFRPCLLCPFLLCFLQCFFAHAAKVVFFLFFISGRRKTLTHTHSINSIKSGKWRRRRWTPLRYDGMFCKVWRKSEGGKECKQSCQHFICSLFLLGKLSQLVFSCWLFVWFCPLKNLCEVFPFQTVPLISRLWLDTWKQLAPASTVVHVELHWHVLYLKMISSY